MHDLLAALLPLVAVLALVVLVARWKGLGTSSQRALRRTMEADPWVSAARFAGLALTEAIDESGGVEATARQAAQAAMATDRDMAGEPPPAGFEALRRRLEVAASAAESAAERAAALSRTIRLRHSEILQAVASSPLGTRVLDRAGSEAMEYLSHAEETASSLDEAADQARRAAADVRSRGSGLLG